MSSQVALSEDVINQANSLKDEANKLFSDKKYALAIEKYTEAIELNPTVPSYYCNRSFAHIKMEAYGAAISDAEASIALDKNFVKGYYRRGIANMAMAKFSESLKDFKMVAKLKPRDADAQSKLKECEKIVRKEKFELAIQSDNTTKSIAEAIDLDSIIVEENYDGYKIEDDKEFNLEFIEDTIERFKNQKKIHRKYAYMLLLKAKEIFTALPSLVDIDIPENAKLTVCGDTHGQYYDLLNIFKINGTPSSTNMYLFNGDFVDRGSFSVEVILTLIMYKVVYPNSIFLNRGNHETDNMNKVYGFEGEVKAKFSDMMFKLFSEIFNALPLAHLVKEKILVVHGGLFSKDDVTLDDIRKINRFSQPPNEGLMCDLLWSDPQPQNGRSPSKRGIGIQFGPDVTHKFLEQNNLDLLIRSHEVKDTGYVIEHDGKCVTVFSAPNYCDSVGNEGAFIHIDSNLKLDYHKFSAVSHPNVRAMAYANQFGQGYF